jgi:pimeloyl-ACP methyl ester carboxylesterase
MKQDTVRRNGLAVTTHKFKVPLDYSKSKGKTIEVNAREVVALKHVSEDLPYLLFLQGGPGFPCDYPIEFSTWVPPMLEKYRILFLDQRGTGRSAVINHQTLARFKTPQEQADYLKHFRADSIVRDAEHIRKELIGNKTWSIIGQSFGGFCACTYLSFAPEGLSEALLFGGLPPIGHSPQDVYRETYKQVLRYNGVYYQIYPQDIEQVRKIVDYLDNHDVRLPDGNRLSSRRFLQLGLEFGIRNSYDYIHHLVDTAFVRGKSGPELNFTFLKKVYESSSFETNPIYTLLHEAIYCEGRSSRWAAYRMLGEFPEFKMDPNQAVYFTGEMIYPWMFDEYNCLKPLKEAAEILAAYEDWPKLYDPAVLSKNDVPSAATIYYNDMYVARRFAKETAKNIKGMKVWITNEYYHSGLRDSDGAEVVKKLWELLHGEAEMN